MKSILTISFTCMLLLSVTTVIAQEMLPLTVLAQQYAAGLRLSWTNNKVPAWDRPEAADLALPATEIDPVAHRRWQILQSWAVTDETLAELGDTLHPEALDGPQTEAGDDKLASPQGPSPLLSSSSSSSSSSSRFINWEEDFTIYAPAESNLAVTNSKNGMIQQKHNQMGANASQTAWVAAAEAEDLAFNETLAVFYQTVALAQKPFASMEVASQEAAPRPSITKEQIKKFYACLKTLKPYLPAALRANTKALVKLNQTRKNKGDFYCTTYLGQRLQVAEEDLTWNLQFLNEVGDSPWAVGYLVNAYRVGEDPARARWWQLAWQANYHYWLLRQDVAQDHPAKILSEDQLRQIFAHSSHGMTSLSSVQRLRALEDGLAYLKAQDWAN